jgi:sugar lactone lactonase YvrE
MAGSHQLWRLDLKEGVLAPYAGSGAEAIDDGPLAEATLAQPMALATDERALYFADAESSSVRRAPLDGEGSVETLVGTGLFEFGDVDAAGDEARFQHAAGLAWGQGNHRLWVADTYNDKLKLLDPATRAAETVEPFDAELDEPMGIASAGHQCLVADTNHHRVLRVDQIDKRVVELEIKGV